MTKGGIEFVARIRGGGSPFGVLELPQDDAACSGTLRFSGWALDDSAVAEVAIGIRGGQKLGSGAVIPNQRPDVAAVFTGYPHLDRTGWEYFLPCGQLTGNRDQIEVTAIDHDGNSTLLELERSGGRHEQ